MMPNPMRAIAPPALINQARQMPISSAPDHASAITDRPNAASNGPRKRRNPINSSPRIVRQSFGCGVEDGFGG